MNKFAIFIDFDGVLIHEKDGLRPRTGKYETASAFKFDPDAVSAITKLLSELDYLGLDPILVLSTSWIKYVSTPLLKELLTDHFHARYIDDTLTFGCSHTPTRYHRIEEWLWHCKSQLRNINSFFILDDSNSGSALCDFRNFLEFEPSEIDRRTFLVDYDGAKVFSYDHVEIVISQIKKLDQLLFCPIKF